LPSKSNTIQEKCKSQVNPGIGLRFCCSIFRDFRTNWGL